MKSAGTAAGAEGASLRPDALMGMTPGRCHESSASSLRPAGSLVECCVFSLSSMFCSTASMHARLKHRARTHLPQAVDATQFALDLRVQTKSLR
jgi:hypothetical protein